MKNLTVRKQISNERISQVGAASPRPDPAPAFFAEEEFLAELQDNAFEINLHAGPGIPLGSEIDRLQIDPDEFETVFLWFLS